MFNRLALIPAVLAVTFVAYAAQTALVLRVGGDVKANGKPVIAGQMWGSGDKITLAKGAQIIWLNLAPGERMGITGPAELEVTDTGVTVRKGRAKKLSTIHTRFSLEGENTRRIGGSVVRDTKPPEPRNSRFDKIEVDQTTQQLEVSCPANANESAAPVLYLNFYSAFSGLDIDKKSGGLIHLAGTTEPQPIAAREVQPERAGDRWVYRTRLPQSEGAESFGLRVVTADREELLYTRVRSLSVTERTQVEQWAKETQIWSSQQPKSAEPWLAYASLLDDKSLVQQAREAAARAYRLEPKNPGVRVLYTRVLMDSGRCGDAKKLLFGRL